MSCDVSYALHLGDCVEKMKLMEDHSIDSIVCDPPYFIGFMNKEFDKQHKRYDGENEGQQIESFHGEWVSEAYRILKPGGYVIAFAGSRTIHRLMTALEDHQFIIHPILAWCFAQGFPKATNLSKQFDRIQGCEGKVIGQYKAGGTARSKDIGAKTSSALEEYEIKNEYIYLREPVSEEAIKWNGWFYGKQTLKPSLEPIAVAQKPLEFKRMVDNIRKYHIGCFNINGTRLEPRECSESGWSKTGSKESDNRAMSGKNYEREPQDGAGIGRWPPQLLLENHQSVEELFNKTSKSSYGFHVSGDKRNLYGKYAGGVITMSYGDSGSVSRFFPHFDHEEYRPIYYCAKASKREREMGCDALEDKPFRTTGDGIGKAPHRSLAKAKNHHVSVKPLDLMRWLVRLITPKQGTILDPFMGSGTTGMAALLEGCNFVGIEKDESYFGIAKARIEYIGG